MMLNLPKSMRLVTTAVPGGPDVMQLKEGPLPIAQKDGLLVRVMAAGVNRPDIAQRKGLYPPPPGAGPILGLEIAGEVVATGPQATQFKCGDLVCGLTNGGGYAEYCAVPETQCLRWPKHYTAVEAAALPENYFTVWAYVFQQGHLTKQSSLLVHGGTSGIGTAAIQLAHEFAGKVYATAGSAKKCAACLKLGATAAVLYHQEDFVQRIAELTQQKGVDMILDMVGAAYFSRNMDCLAIGGRLIEISALQGAIVDHLDLRKLMAKRLTITGSTLRPQSTAEKAAIARGLYQSVWPVLDAGRCKPVIDQVFPLGAVVEAHQLMESSQHIGKIMLEVTPL